MMLTLLMAASYLYLRLLLQSWNGLSLNVFINFFYSIDLLQFVWSICLMFIYLYILFFFHTCKILQQKSKSMTLMKDQYSFHPPQMLCVPLGEQKTLQPSFALLMTLKSLFTSQLWIIFQRHSTPILERKYWRRE